MKTCSLALCALVLLGGAPHTLAASSVDLSVNGVITPTACTPLLSSNGVIDYGKISQQDLNVDKGTRLPVKQLQVSIGCNAASRFALRMRDNRDGTATVNSEIY
jgi:type 1 fimbria pilin